MDEFTAMNILLEARAFFKKRPDGAAMVEALQFGARALGRDFVAAGEPEVPAFVRGGDDG